MKIKLFAITSLLITLPLFCYASGTTGDSGSYGQSDSKPTRQIDQVYERGKAIYTGRSKQYRKYKFCIIDKTSQKPVKITSKRLKPFKKTTYQQVANEIVKCDEADKAITSIVHIDDLALIVYYLDKRYRLKLKQ